MSEPFDAFDKWWSEHYSMANLARGAAEDAWNAATEHAAKVCEAMTWHKMTSPKHVATNGPADYAAAIRRGTP